MVRAWLSSNNFIPSQERLHLYKMSPLPCWNSHLADDRTKTGPRQGKGHQIDQMGRRIWTYATKSGQN